MDYIEINIFFDQPDPWKEIFTTVLAETGCESFMDGDNENTLLAYIPQPIFDEQDIPAILSNHGFDTTIRFTLSKIEAQDWNSVWESNYAPVMIGEKCYIRAPFHEKNSDVEYEIIIEPKMSFGTAHHETTSLMLEYLLEEDLHGKSVLDVGSGTGILAILAHQKGASDVTAIDNDEWAYQNNIENNARNGIGNMKVILGDISHINGQSFDIILANINRNILLQDIPDYAKALNKGGLLFMSGFYDSPDHNMIQQKCAEENLRYINFKEKNNWVAAKYVKS